MTEPHVDRVLRVLRHLALEAGALSLQPKGMGVVGAHGADCCALVPPAKIQHPYPQHRFIVQHSRWEPSALAAHARIRPEGAG
jgi:hypothetical protein